MLIRQPGDLEGAFNPRWSLRLRAAILMQTTLIVGNIPKGRLDTSAKSTTEQCPIGWVDV